MSIYRRDEVNQSARINKLQKNVYHTYELNTELDTGKKWIDGSKIYTQTFKMLTPGIGDISLPHEITGLDLILHGAVGYCLLVDGTKIPLPVINHASSGGGAGSSLDAGNTITIIEWDDTNMLGYIGTNYITTKAVDELVFTIEYTKVQSWSK